MTDSPRKTQNRNVEENQNPINKRSIGGNAMKSAHRRLLVSDMVKKFTQPNTTPIGDRTTSGVRQGPQVATCGSPASSRTTPTASKPGGSSSRLITAPKPFQAQNKPIGPKSKMDFESRKAAAVHNKNQEENRRPSWIQQREEPEKKKYETVQPWNQRHKQQDKAEKSHSTCAQQRDEQKEEKANHPTRKMELMRAKQKEEKTSENALKSKSREDSISARNGVKPKPDDDQVSASNGHRRGFNPPHRPIVGTKPSTVPWSKTNRLPDEFPAPPAAEKISDNLTPKRSTAQSKSFTGHQTMLKPTIEKSSGSFSSSSPKMARKNYVAPAALSTDISPQKRVNSFLHTGPKLHGLKPNTANGLPLPPPSLHNPQKSIGVPRRLPIPEEKYYESPPRKASKPTKVVLPRNGNISMLPPAPLIEEDIYDDTGEEPQPQPQMTPPPMVKRESPGSIPTWSDEEEAVYDETPDELQAPARPLIPTGFPMPVAPPQIHEEQDEMYEDIGEYMRLKELQTQQEQQPNHSQEGDEMYEDVGEYIRLKKLQTQQEQQLTNGSVPGGKDKKKKDKKKKDSEKREKDTRQKFKLPVEGEIVTQGQGIVKEACKGFGKNLGVTKAERIEIIRMTDNPKGKLLIRNTQGDYGYIESEKVTIDVNQIRHTFGVGGIAPSGIGCGPPVPTGIIPTISLDDDEAIYDETADEDIYEEV